MKKGKWTTIITALLLFTLLISGCGNGEAAQSSSALGSTKDMESSSFAESTKTEDSSAATQGSGTAGSSTATVTDMTGRKVELPEEVKRVVVLSAADCEIVYELGREDLLVGRGEYCDWPEKAKEIESVQSGDETNIEQIIALEPDLILMSSMAQTNEQVQQLEKAGITVVLVQADTIAEVYQAIELIGTCLDAEDEASSLVSEMKQGFLDLQENLPESGGSIYFEVSPLEYGLWTAGTDTFMDEIANMLNLENCFSDISGWAEISQEQVIERSPDYIVTITMYYGEGDSPEVEILGRVGWENITAVKEKQVFLMNSDELSRPGPRLLQAAQNLRDLVYGSN